MYGIDQKPLWATPTDMEVAQRDQISGSDVLEAHLELLSESGQALRVRRRIHPAGCPSFLDSGRSKLVIAAITGG
jgi:hypothetical protein